MSSISCTFNSPQKSGFMATVCTIITCNMFFLIILNSVLPCLLTHRAPVCSEASSAHFPCLPADPCQGDLPLFAHLRGILRQQQQEKKEKMMLMNKYTQVTWKLMNMWCACFGKKRMMQGGQITSKPTLFGPPTPHWKSSAALGTEYCCGVCWATSR